jgi:RimJ/RimL family protein N-acetyltransferase
MWCGLCEENEINSCLWRMTDEYKGRPTPQEAIILLLDFMFRQKFSSLLNGSEEGIQSSVTK